MESRKPRDGAEIFLLFIYPCPERDDPGKEKKQYVRPVDRSLALKDDMISRITGIVAGKSGTEVLLETGGITYEIMVPQAVMKAMGSDMVPGNRITLFTHHYYQTEPSKSVPVLIGFQNEVEREFFEKFITVSGVGPKAAARALAESFSSIAGAIDRGDAAFLKTLPGIGDQRARLIVAKLQGKVGKYGLIKDEGFQGPVEGVDDVKEEALEVLLRLQYKKTEAEEMIRKALIRKPGIKTSEELLNEVYRDRKTL
ncbi:MAG: Holliday junction ATP-dependent DNA helicase RuvA [Candidatus Omnitrophica bacterium]|jgi:Holliday junction DNA helicase RuvA|nr:Holliday junction ATP-dependent DNA helicase RuvA [Candidatus Omnitrophota bacterium]